MNIHNFHGVSTHSLTIGSASFIVNFLKIARIMSDFLIFQRILVKVASQKGANYDNMFALHG